MSKKPKGWYDAITMRSVVHEDGYEHYEKVCGHVADIFFSVEEKELRQRVVTNSEDSIYVTLYSLYKVGKAKCPAYYQC